MRDTQRERKRQRHRQREKQAPCREPDVGLDPGTPGSRPGPKAGAKPLSHPGIPQSIFKVFGFMSYRNFRILLISAKLQKEVTCYTGTLLPTKLLIIRFLVLVPNA